MARIPYAGLIQATDGNLYGTTHGGGANNSGTVLNWLWLLPRPRPPSSRAAV